MKRLGLAFMVLLVCLTLALLILLRPLGTQGLESRPHPASTYAEALLKVAELESADGADVSPECRTELMTHGGRTPNVVVLLHGLSNCPAQFDSLGRLAFKRGANVLIPRAPRHGRSDRMTEDLSRMQPREIRAFVDQVVDAAEGLGDTVTIAGLSIGGVMAAWAGQERPDVHRIVLIAPMLGVAAAPALFSPAVTRLAATFPNVFMWWDPVAREKVAGPRHVYPRFATHAVTAVLLFGSQVMADAARTAPQCRSIAIVTVGSDLAVDNGAAAELARRWRAHGARDLTTYQFPRRLGLPHDIVDPEQVNGNPARTYPVLLSFIRP
jgi:pimeloyl-ACP methyl ester carboxylesterase